MSQPSLVRMGDVAADESGQTVIEYILLLSAVVSFYMLLVTGLSRIGVMDLFTRPISQTFAATYRYGHPKGKGYDDGGPENHPRAREGGTNNFRIFINPGKK